MITPYDIESKEFTKAVRGYNIEEVDAFLDEITIDIEKLMSENDKLKDKVEELTADKENYKKSEASVLNTLESAKHLMNDISASAEKRAEIIIRNAKLDADVIMRDAKDNVSRLNNENANLRAKVSRFRERYRTLLENEITSLDSQSDDLLADLEREFYPASMQQEAATPESFAEPVKPAEETPAAQPEVKSVKQTPAKTYDSDSLEDMLKRDFASDPSQTLVVGEDLTKTRIIK